ncbi:MAG TPA: hypothetical protein VH682_10715 [Gemmataceae bacterium]|jgi:hypothetical protein
MPQQRFDIGSKWLLHKQGKGVLFVGGFKNVQRIETMPGEIVQNRKYPDGLLQVYLRGQRKPHHVLIEIATYSEERALQQALDDLTLSYQTLGHLPELLMMVLHPKGQFRIRGRHEVRSKLGLSRLEVEWKVVELWTLPATEFLTQGDVVTTPWVPLMEFTGPPETLLERCAEKIEREAHPKDRADLLVVSQVMAGLRFPDPALLQLLGGREPMIESPLLKKWLGERMQKAILALLKARFGSVPRDVRRLLGEVLDEDKLTSLNVLAAQCPDMEAFRQTLLS